MLKKIKLLATSQTRVNRPGFTVIELLIAIGVMGLAIPSMAMALRNLTAINHRARNVALTNIIVGNKAEQIRSAGFNSIAVGTVDFTNELPPELAKPRSATYTITRPTAGVDEVTLTVSYKDYNKTRTLTYKTIISELGVGQ
ncbi:MAG TPA: prepilin-type N-terminal cleavage/methylation domain-containing protein [Patescibacteria group bacterium]|nr:prepilin-type N-terminal cleavage/methylation domain-containing protein [Patescibacteria group bacterium]